MTKGHNLANEKLRSYINRIERLDEEKRALGADTREVYKEAKAAGFEPKVMRELIRERRMAKDEWEELHEQLERYRRAVAFYEGADDAA